jgi:hypothetical protein
MTLSYPTEHEIKQIALVEGTRGLATKVRHEAHDAANVIALSAESRGRTRKALQRAIIWLDALDAKSERE